MTEKFIEFRDTLSERIKSPFVGAFLVTWILLHWEILLLLFYNENNLTLSDRIARISDYLTLHGVLGLLVYPILYTLLILLSHALLNSIALLIKLTYDNWLSPLIQKWIYNKSIIQKSKFEKVKIELVRVKKELDQSTESNIDLVAKIDNLTSEKHRFESESFRFYDVTLVELFGSGEVWANKYTTQKGEKGIEYFMPEENKISIIGGGSMPIKNIRHIPELKIYVFDKIIGDSVLNNVVVANGNKRFTGTEELTTNISYYKILEPLVLKATYGVANRNIDVTKVIGDLFSKKKFEFIVSNDYFGDPHPGNKKVLDVQFVFNGKLYSKKFEEGDLFKMA